MYRNNNNKKRRICSQSSNPHKKNIKLENLQYLFIASNESKGLAVGSVLTKTVKPQSINVTRCSGCFKMFTLSDDPNFLINNAFVTLCHLDHLGSFHICNCETDKKYIYDKFVSFYLAQVTVEITANETTANETAAVSTQVTAETTANETVVVIQKLYSLIDIDNIIKFKITDEYLLAYAIHLIDYDDAEELKKYYTFVETFMKSINNKFIKIYQYSFYIIVDEERFDILEKLYQLGVFNNEILHKSIPYYASGLNKIKVLDWWYDTFEVRKYDSWALDRACANGNIEAFKWWLSKFYENNNFDLKYSTNAFDYACQFCKIGILQIWYDNRDKLLELGKKLLYTNASIDIIQPRYEQETLASNDLRFCEISGMCEITEEHNLYNISDINTIDNTDIDYINEDYDDVFDNMNQYYGTLKTIVIDWFNDVDLEIKFTLDLVVNAYNNGLFFLINEIIKHNAPTSNSKLCFKSLGLTTDVVETYWSKLTPEYPEILLGLKDLNLGVEYLYKAHISSGGSYDNKITKDEILESYTKNDVLLDQKNYSSLMFQPSDTIDQILNMDITSNSYIEIANDYHYGSNVSFDDIASLIEKYKNNIGLQYKKICVCKDFYTFLENF